MRTSIAATAGTSHCLGAYRVLYCNSNAVQALVVHKNTQHHRPLVAAAVNRRSADCCRSLPTSGHVALLLLPALSRPSRCADTLLRSARPELPAPLQLLSCAHPQVSLQLEHLRAATAAGCRRNTSTKQRQQQHSFHVISTARPHGQRPATSRLASPRLNTPAHSCTAAHARTPTAMHVHKCITTLNKESKNVPAHSASACR
jgi:hypothetical protein